MGLLRLERPPKPTLQGKCEFCGYKEIDVKTRTCLKCKTTKAFRAKGTNKYV
jgi:hypothetical protein